MEGWIRGERRSLRRRREISPSGEEKSKEGEEKSKERKKMSLSNKSG